MAEDEVRIGILIHQVENVDMVAQTIQLRFAVFLTYKDPKFFEHYQPEWKDRVFSHDFINSKSPDSMPQLLWQTMRGGPEELYPHARWFDPESQTLTAIHEIRASFFDPVDARAFPYDSQRYRIRVGLKAINGLEGTTKFVESGMLGFDDGCEECHTINNDCVSEWKVHGKINQEIQPTPGFGCHGFVEWTVRLTRHSLFYDVNLMFMLAAFNTIVLFSFVYDVTDVQSRAALTTAILFATIALKFSFLGSLPSLPYMTLVDKKFTCSYVLIAFLFVVHHVEYAFEVSRHIDAILAGLFVFLAAVFEIVFFVIRCRLSRQKHRQA